MSLAGKLAALGPIERRAMLQAAVAVPLVRLALLLLPYRAVHRLVATVMRRSRGRSNVGNATPDQIARMVATVAARVPRASCLTQALAAALMLARHGHPATLRVGVARSEDGALRAHAWLESGGRIILGGPDDGAFSHLPPLSFDRR